MWSNVHKPFGAHCPDGIQRTWRLWMRNAHCILSGRSFSSRSRNISASTLTVWDYISVFTSVVCGKWHSFPEIPSALDETSVGPQCWTEHPATRRTGYKRFKKKKKTASTASTEKFGHLLKFPVNSKRRTKPVNATPPIWSHTVIEW
jgi:hypothetical protein